MYKKKIILFSLIINIVLIISGQLVSAPDPGEDGTWGTDISAKQPFEEELTQALGEGTGYGPANAEQPTTITSTAPLSPISSASIPAGATVFYEDNTFYSTLVNSIVTKAGIVGNNVFNVIARGDGSLAGTSAQKLSIPRGNGELVDVESSEVFDVQTNGNFILRSAERAYSPRFEVIDGIDIITIDDFISVDSANEIKYLNAIMNDVEGFKSLFPGVFELSKAETLVIKSNNGDDNIFENLDNASFAIDGEGILSTILKPTKDNDNVTFTNPIPKSSETITVEYDLGERVKLDYSQITSDNRKVLEIVCDEGTTIKIGNITFTPLEGQGPGSIIIIEGSPPEYKIKNGKLNFTSEKFIESIESSCEYTSAEIDYGRGFKRVVLSPLTTVLCSGGKYSYIDKIVKQKSFSIVNTGTEEYEIGFNKLGLLPYNLFSAGIMDQSWGYVNLQDFIELNGIVEYNRYREMFQGENPEEYKNSNLIFLPAYSSYQQFNKANIQIDDMYIDLNVKNSDVDPNTVSICEINSGFHRFSEKIVEGELTRRERFNIDIMHPPFMRFISTDFGPATPNINIKRGTLGRQCANGQSIRILTPGSSDSQLFQADIQARSSIGNYKELVSRIK